jgi:flavodoxin
MNRALIFYHSRRGTTAEYGGEISAQLFNEGIKTKVLPMYMAPETSVEGFDTIFLGCWTSGWLFFNQKPEKNWVQYLKQIPDLSNKDIVLFTTYKILTGSMFREMAKHLPENTRVSFVKLKSRNGKLTDSNKQLLRLLTHGYVAPDSESPMLSTVPVSGMQKKCQLSLR